MLLSMSCSQHAYGDCDGDGDATPALEAKRWEGHHPTLCCVCISSAVTGEHCEGGLCPTTAVMLSALCLQ